MKLPTAFRDSVRVFRSGGPGQRDPNTGIWTKPDDVVLYEGPANVQAGGLLKSSRRAVGTPFSEADGRAALPKTALGRLLTIVPGDSVAITYEPIRNQLMVEQYGADAEVTFVIPESREVLLRYR